MKFAYLIMAHDNEEQLRMLIDVLDHPENDIYLHVDKKSGLKDAKFTVKKAKIHLHDRFSVYWGDISQTKCQMFLLKEAVKEHHDYYHLLSGHDLPIKTHDQIKAFFEKNNGKQFIHFESDGYCTKEAGRYYHMLNTLISRCRIGVLKKILMKPEDLFVAIQRGLGIQRKLYCGSNWFSITHDLAEELCLSSDRILRKVRWSICSDEYVLQTFYKTMAGKKYELFAETKAPGDYKGTAREIDWDRGTPYVWRDEDFDHLMNSDRMFARKFDMKTDDRIIKRICEIVGCDDKAEQIIQNG